MTQNNDAIPATEEVRRGYASGPGRRGDPLVDYSAYVYFRANSAAFDRWLASVQAAAWEEGKDDERRAVIDGVWPRNPYRESK